jgi:hypothetical protein
MKGAGLRRSGGTPLSPLRHDYASRGVAREGARGSEREREGARGSERETDALCSASDSEMVLVRAQQLIKDSRGRGLAVPHPLLEQSRESGAKETCRAAPSRGPRRDEGRWPPLPGVPPSSGASQAPRPSAASNAFGRQPACDGPARGCPRMGSVSKSRESASYREQQQQQLRQQQQQQHEQQRDQEPEPKRSSRESPPSWKMVELHTSTGGRLEGHQRESSSSRLHYTVLTVLDAVFSATIAGPAVVGYWRGTWGLSGFYIYPEDAELSSLTSILIGFCGLFSFNLAQHVLDECLRPDKNRLLFYLGSRLYTAVFGFCCVNAWRGAWQALDLYTEHTFNTVFTTTCVSLLALAIMRTLRNISAPPFAISHDAFAGYFEVPTLFRVNVSESGFASSS